MNQVWEIIGIVIAILMVLMGLRLLIKKPQPEQPIEQADILIEAHSQQPIVPRHLRQASGQAMQPTITLPKVENIPIQQTKEEEITGSDEPIKAENQLETEEQVLNSELKQEEIELPVKQIKEHEGIPATKQSAQENEIKDAESETEQPDTDKSADDKTSLQMTEIETVEIEEWQGESDVLDAHLSAQDRNDEESALATAEQLVALYMYPNPVRALSGERTLKMMLKYGLRFGEMSCFHRYQHPEHPSPLMFSVLRINEDGAPTGFDLETLPNEEVKGLAFFLALPNPNAVQGFDMMASIAGLIARDTEGLVFDEQSLELTPQLRDHWRHFVIEFRSGQTS